MILAASPLSAANGGASVGAWPANGGASAGAWPARGGASVAAPPATGGGGAAPESKTFVVRVDRSSGRLVRRELAQTPPPKAPVKAVPPAIARLVDESSRAHGIDPRLVHSVIQVESNYNPSAVSPKGAEGLMQLAPATARMLGVSNSFDPGENIEAGVRYLKYLQNLYKDDRLALAAYNAGPGAVEKYKTIPPYSETRKYVEKVGQKYEAAKVATPADPAAKAPGAASIDPAADEEKYSRVERFIDKDGRLHLEAAP
ncbi:MAG TPA: lytic transglycosylase domain-containing protein [Bryobacteraceae bacterium]|nr:lytic transglycosylase domain-containing protein [Bryobacteraceae bacterium]